MKCFTVHFEGDIMIWAKDRIDARRIAQENLESEAEFFTVSVAESKEPAAGWDNSYLIHHDGLGDITVAEALKLNVKGESDGD